VNRKERFFFFLFNMNMEATPPLASPSAHLAAVERLLGSTFDYGRVNRQLQHCTRAREALQAAPAPWRDPARAPTIAGTDKTPDAWVYSPPPLNVTLPCLNGPYRCTEINNTWRRHTYVFMFFSIVVPRAFGAPWGQFFLYMYVLHGCDRLFSDSVPLSL
jgi:hypothetical protein